MSTDVKTCSFPSSLDIAQECTKLLPTSSFLPLVSSQYQLLQALKLYTIRKNLAALTNAESLQVQALDQQILQELKVATADTKEKTLIQRVIVRQAPQRIELAYEEFGPKNGPVILMIAGLATQMTSWSTSFIELFTSQGFRVVRFDNRDCGLSSTLGTNNVPDLKPMIAKLLLLKQTASSSRAPYSLRDMAGDAICLMDTLHIDKAHIVGASMGGMIAQWIAITRPDRVLTLTSIMSNTGDFTQRKYLPSLQVIQMILSSMMQSSKTSLASDDKFNQLVDAQIKLRTVLRGSAYPFQDMKLLRTDVAVGLRRAHDPAGTVRQVAAILTGPDRRADLARLAMPVLVIHGTADPLIPIAAGEEVAQTIPQAQFLPLEGMGHDIPSALNEKISQAVLSMIKKKTSEQSPPDGKMRDSWTCDSQTVLGPKSLVLTTGRQWTWSPPYVGTMIRGRPKDSTDTQESYSDYVWNGTNWCKQ